ncbi:MAG TPA: glycosyltransferase family 4 protein [Gaiellaceae bacterium]
MRILYVTSSFPYGHGEAFLSAEVDELLRQGHELTIVPTLARGGIVHADARALLSRTRRVSPFGQSVAASAVRAAGTRPAASAGLLRDIARSRSPRILAKNLAVTAKGHWLGELARADGADHIHAHWGGTSATIAMAASRVSGIPWSFTVHRWDIRERNLLREKALSASFVRAISEDGLDDLRQATGETATPCFVLHMGVHLPAAAAGATGSHDAFRLLVPAGFLEVKGHVHLIDALRLLRDRGGPRIVAELAGDGPLREPVARQIAAAGLDRDCLLLGQLPHEDLLRRLEAGEWDAVALASVETASGEKEGIPVVFLEAMSHGLPVIGTAIGAIPELLGDASGLLVPQRDAVALADAIERLALDSALARTLGARGRLRVEREFAVESVVRELVLRMAAAQAPAQRKSGARRPSARSSRIRTRRR